jgi:small subunit ribosomal protein S6
MRTYEIIFILKPDVAEEEADRFISQMEGVVTSTGGTIRKLDKMGVRHLAYTIGRYRDGRYYLFTVDCDVATVKEFERRLRVAEPVIKFLSVRIDEEMKRLEKLQGIRAKKLARKKPRGGPEPRGGSEPRGGPEPRGGSEPAAASA